jgi:hypothetical protein
LSQVSEVRILEPFSIEAEIHPAPISKDSRRTRSCSQSWSVSALLSEFTRAISITAVVSLRWLGGETMAAIFWPAAVSRWPGR